MKNKAMFKKEGEELQQYLIFYKHHSYIKNKKGKGSYDRNRLKQKDKKF